MKKIFTQTTASMTLTKKSDGRRSEPRKITIELLKQFARAYRPMDPFQGIVLN
jgi:hypothetical protein